jgi:hypothetical protein
MIYQEVPKNLFIDMFESSSTYANQFSREVLEALFDHLEQLSEDTGTDISMDIVAFCCDYAEYTSHAEAVEECGEEIELIAQGPKWVLIRM